MRATSHTILLLLISLLITGLTPSFAYAEGGGEHIKGRVMSAQEHSPIAGATIEIIQGHTKLGQTQSNESGHFSLHVQASGACTVRVSHLSFEVYHKQHKMSSGTTDLGTLMLQSKSRDLSEFVVTSTRTMRHLKEVPVPTQVITRSQIERIAPTTMKDILLYSIPGVEFSQHGGITHITMQGYSAEYIAFLIDGEELAGLKTGSLDFSRLSPDNIERIEVIKGAGSALYGSNAIGGVINIITRNNQQPYSLSSSVGYAQAGGINSHLSLGIKRKAWSSLLSGSYDREGGYTLRTKDGAQAMNVVRNDVMRAGNKLRWSPTEKVMLHHNISWSQRRQHRDEYRHDLYRYLTNNLKGTYLINAKSHLSLTYNNDISWRHRYFPKKDSTILLHDNMRQLLRLQYDHHINEGSDISIGAEGHSEMMLSDQISSASARKHIEYGVLFGQHLWRITSGLDLMYGMRADIHSTYGLHLSPKATLSYKNQGWMLRAGYSRAFKSPTIMELYFDWSHQGSFMIYGNPDLKPEKADQLLFNAEWSSGRVTLSGGVTHTLFKDRISMYTDDAQNQRHYNVEGHSRMTIADAQLSWRPCNGLSLFGSYTYTHSPMIQKYEGKEYDLSSVRPHNLLARVEGFKSWNSRWSTSLTLIGQYLSGIDFYTLPSASATDKMAKRQEYKGYPMFRASMSVSYNRKATLTIGADNLLDYHADNLGYQNASLTPGRSFFAKVHLTLP